MRKARFGSLVALVAAAVACSSGDLDAPEGGAGGAPAIASAEIGPEGGQVEAACGSVAIEAGALADATAVRVETIELALPGPLEARGSFCRVDFGQATLAKPAQITLHYDAIAFPDEAIPPTLMAVGQQPSGGGWSSVWMPTLPSGGALTASVSVPGTYGVALALANNAVCSPSLSYCAALVGGAGPNPPPGWTPIPGTNIGAYEMGVLWKYVKNPGYLSEGLCAVAVACNWDGLSGKTQIDILTKCKKLPCPYDMVCASEIVAKELQQDPSNVCRHYAWGVREALALLGYSGNFECGWDGMVGHAWVKVDCGGSTYLLDAMSHYYISTTGPVPVMCGNELVEAGEQCDGDPSVCSVDSDCVGCQCVARCGNGSIDPGEQCETHADCPFGTKCDGCQCVPGTICGNEYLEPGEQCEDGFPCPTGQSCEACQCVQQQSAVCGNGSVESGEQCETDAHCDSSSQCQQCQCVSLCGNDKLDPNEQCDGPSNTCSAGKECVNCQCLDLCGNNKVDPGEQCDGVGIAQCTGQGQECYACKCQLFVQCAGIADAGQCAACCEGATAGGSAADFAACMAANCQ